MKWKEDEITALFKGHVPDAVALLVSRYYKGKLKSNNLYRIGLKGILRRNCMVFSDNNLYGILVGNYVKEQDYCKQMMHDVVEDRIDITL